MEAAKGAEKIVETMMLDREMAGEVYERLGEALEAKKGSQDPGSGGG